MNRPNITMFEELGDWQIVLSPEWTRTTTSIPVTRPDPRSIVFYPGDGGNIQDSDFAIAYATASGAYFVNPAIYRPDIYGLEIKEPARPTPKFSDIFKIKHERVHNK